ncbi:Flp pilus assembly protein RcpC/CpaB [Caprobacter fermentans]|uniref:Flp pilus assembly protein RcpC/CpaB n=1 Tax=Caproicibacter fermentans TaxID=2576756 RepID=A0A6N8HXA8_9FIRM|nr:Flp pilus assembly protein CpaB [Caproicibacter fermentans]MVB10446.1 Flp pilus assembly protein RcpC/CpaB [Caproicibacter fermentans]
MKKLFRNRTFLGIASILMAMLICFGLAPAVNKASNRQTQIVRVTKSIPEGAAITKEMIATVNVGSFNLPANVLRSEKDAVGKYTKAELEPGDYILSTKISDQSQSPYLTDLDGQKQAISISIKSLAAGLSGKLQAGDIISLIVSDYGDGKQTVAPPELKYVKLLAATTSKGTDTDPSKKDDNKEDDNSDNIPSTLTLLVSSAQAEKLVDYETNGQLYAALVYRGDKQTAQQYLQKQDDYLEQIKAPENGVNSNGQ